MAIANRLQNTFTIVNQTGQSLTSLRVEVCNQKFDLGSIPPNGQTSRTYNITTDSGYSVQATLKDGSRIEEIDGYVTTGYYGVRDRIVLKSNRNITVIQSTLW